MKEVFLHYPTISKFGKHSISVLELSLNTSKQTLNDFQSQFKNASIDFLIFTSFCPEVYTNEFHIPNRIAEGLRVDNAFCVRTETASSSGNSAIHLASRLVQSGRFETGLVVGTEIMSGLERDKSNQLLASVLSDEQRKLGMSMAQGGALVAQRYLHDYGYGLEDLYLLSKKAHDNGLKNPVAHIQKELSWEIYKSQPIFSSPLGLYDISPLSDGSACLIVSSKPGPVKIRGLGHGTANMNRSVVDCSFPASIKAFKMAYEDAELMPKDIEVAELHDAFTIFEIVGMEDAGLAEKGKGLQMVRDCITQIDNRLPINPSGGLKSRGHPIGASGIAQVCEIMKYFEKNPSQKIGMTHSIGGLATNNFVTILENRS
jgi:acetyl-CoA acetyltransferase